MYKTATTKHSNIVRHMVITISLSSSAAVVCAMMRTGWSGESLVLPVLLIAISATTTISAAFFAFGLIRQLKQKP
jgi:hypothetical protein